MLLLMRVGGFLTGCSGEVVSVWLLLMSDVWVVSNSVESGEIASCCTSEGGGGGGGGGRLSLVVKAVCRGHLSVAPCDG